MRQLEGLFRFVKMVWYVSQGSRHTAWMSPRQGYMEFDSVMIGAGNSMCEYELCLLQAGKDPTYLLWYVDHMLMVARSEA